MKNENMTRPNAQRRIARAEQALLMAQSLMQAIIDRNFDGDVWDVASKIDAAVEEMNRLRASLATNDITEALGADE